MCHPCQGIYCMLDLFRKIATRNASASLLSSSKTYKNFLTHFNGVTLFKKPVITDLAPIYLDTCLSSTGGILGDRAYAAPTLLVPGFDLKIVHLEMTNVVVALRLWGEFWRHSSIHIYCDNEAVVQVVTSHKTKDLFLAACIRNIC